MSLDLNEMYKAASLLPPAAITSTTSSSTTLDVEVYDDDALVVCNYGSIGAGGSVIVTVLGSLVATPSTYDQTLATFVSASTSYTLAATRAKLAGIKNLSATATLPGSTSVAVTVVVLLDAGVNKSGLNSATAA